MDQRDSHCPYSLSSEITAKPTVLGLLVCDLCHVSQYHIIIFWMFSVLKIFGLRVRYSDMLKLQSFFFFATAGQEDPFELDSNLSLSSGRHGEVVRGSTTVRSWNTATWRFGWLTVHMVLYFIDLFYSWKFIIWPHRSWWYVKYRSCHGSTFLLFLVFVW